MKFCTWSGMMPVSVLAGKDLGVMVGTRLSTSPDCNYHE